jgi:hypothetical protein
VLKDSGAHRQNRRWAPLLLVSTSSHRQRNRRLAHVLGRRAYRSCVPGKGRRPNARVRPLRSGQILGSQFPRQDQQKWTITERAAREAGYSPETDRAAYRQS